MRERIAVGNVLEMCARERAVAGRVTRIHRAGLGLARTTVYTVRVDGMDYMFERTPENTWTLQGERGEWMLDAVRK